MVQKANDCDDEEAVRLARQERSTLANQADQEMEDNKLEQRRRHGDNLYYGQEVQLYSEHYGKFLHVSGTVTSKLEPSNMRVEMNALDGPTAVFKFMPRFKVRAEGDPVRILDQVTLESVATPGQYLHSSVAAFVPPGSQLQHMHEVNLSVSKTAYVVKLFRHPHAVPDGGVCGNDVIQLFHKEIGAYIAAEGVCDPDAPGNFVENVHLRVRLPDPGRPSRLLPPTSAVSFWQVEHQTASDGRAVLWEDAIRLRHYTTGLYLRCGQTALAEVVRSESGVRTANMSLSTEKDEYGLFRLDPVIRESDTLQNGTYSRIEHVASGFWLHALKDVPYDRVGKTADHSSLGDKFAALSNRISKIEWDGAPLVKICVTSERLFDDAFIATHVRSDQVYNVNFVNGMIPILRQYIIDRGNRELTASESEKVTSALGKLRRFFFVLGQEQKIRQKLLRDLKVVELLVDILKIPFQPMNKSESALTLDQLKSDPRGTANTRRVCDAACRVLAAYLEGNSRKNELYIARHIPFFQYLFGTEISMEHMYTELVRDNHKIVNCITEAEISHVVRLLAGGDKNHNYLNFLGVLCECEESPIVHNQHTVAKLLLQDHNDIVYLTNVREGNTGMTVSLDGGKTEHEMHAFVASAMDEDDSTSTDEYLFLQAQLDLFGTLCKGRNAKNIQMITLPPLRYLTWEECFLCVRDGKIPKSLRAKYVELILNLFVDVGSNIDVLSEIQLSYGWDELVPVPYHDAAEDRTESLSGAKMPFFPELAEWLESVLVATRGRMIAASLPNNLFLAEVVKLIVALIRFGYYVHHTDIERLVKPLSSMLDGSNDLPEPPGDGSRRKIRFAPSFKSTAGDGENNAVEDFQKKGRYENNRNNAAIMDVKYSALKALDALFNLVITIRVQVLMFDYKCIHSSTIPNQMKMFGNLSTSQHSTLTTVLEEARRFSRGERSHESISVETSPKLAHQIPGIRAYLQGLLQRTDWVHHGWNTSVGTKPDKQGNAALPSILLDLGRYDHDRLILESFNILGMLYAGQEDMLNNSVMGLILVTPQSNQLAQYCRKHVSVLRQLSERQLEGNDITTFINILKTLGQHCHLPGAPEMPHRMNQKIIDNSNVLGIILNVVKSEIQCSAVLEAAFEFLAHVAFKNEAAQTELFDYLDDMLHVEVDPPHETGWINAMASCVSEIFNGNQHTCLRVQESQINRIVQLIAENKTAAPNLLLALQAVAKIEDLNIPLQRNQNIIMKSLTKYRKDVVATALIDDRSDPEINAQRTELLRGDGTANDVTDRALLQYHLNLVSLLSACAEGENQLIESICQTIFSVEELLAVAIDDAILPMRKGAYLRFFLWVYLNTEAGGSDTGTAELVGDMRLFQSIKLLVMQKLEPMYTQGTGSASKPNSRDMSFAFDALIPLISRVATKFFAPVEFPETKTVMTDVGKILGSFAERAIPHLYDKVYVKSLCASLMKLNETCPGSVPQSAMSAAATKLMAEEASVDESDAERQYRETYQYEEQINADFNNYVVAVKAAYGGINKIEAQLSRKSEAIFKDEMYCEPAGDDQALPLGEEFQAFIELFTTAKGKSYVHDTHLKDEISVVVRHFHVSRQLAGALSADEHERQNEVTARLLQVFRGILHNERVTAEDDDNDPGYIALQNSSVDHGTVLAVANLLNSEDDNVVRESLALLVEILNGGNSRAQGAFADHFLHTREETFFDDVLVRIRRSCEGIVEMRQLRRQTEEERARQKKMMGTLTLAHSFAIDKKILAGESDSTQTQGPGASGAVENLNVTVPNRAFDKNAFSTATDGTILNPLRKQTEALAPTEQEDDGIEIKDEANIELVLRVIQLMCEGHNLTLQNYLRTQPDNIRSLDLVAETVHFADIVTDEMNKDNIDLVIQTFDTLVEFCQGCQGNQADVFNNHVMESVNRVIRELEFGDEGEQPPDYVVANLHLSVAQVILSLLEDSNEETVLMASEVEETLDIKAALNLITVYHDADVERKRRGILWPGLETDPPDDPDEEVPSPFEVGYAWFNVLAQLQDFTNTAYYKSSEYTGLSEDTVHPDYEYFLKEDITIEINREDRLRKIHFCGGTWKDFLRADVRHELNWHVDRSSPTDKIRDFVTRCRTIIADIKYQKGLSEGNVFFRALIVHKGHWRSLLLTLTLIINLMMLAVWDANMEDLHTWQPEVPSWYSPVLLGLGLVHLTASILVALSYLLVNPPWFRELFNSFPELRDKLFGALEGLDADRSRRSPLHTATAYHISLVVFSILGLFFHGYFFSYHFLHIVVDNDILERVVQAVTKNGMSLMQVAALMLIIIYMYTLFAFAYYRNSFVNDDGAFCQTLGECFVTSIRLGMMTGGGLGEALPLPEVYSASAPGYRTIYDLSFFILITIIGLNVVFGIIVDTFSELRDEKQQVQEAMNSECFICSRKAYEFDRFGSGFAHHVEKEHYMWNYLFYMLYLSEKDPTEFNSNEQYFVESIQNEEEAAVFPINKAQCLESMNEEPTDKAEVVGSKILEQLQVLMAKVDKLEKDRVVVSSNDNADMGSGADGSAGDGVDTQYLGPIGRRRTSSTVRQLDGEMNI